MKIISIEKEQFDSFARKHKYRSFYQSSIYARIMPKFNYEVSYIGITNDNDDNLIGAAVLLLQEAFMKNKIAYAPRGILFDFTDATRTEELVDALKNDLGKNGIISLRIDPCIPINIRDSKGNIQNINNEAKMIMANLEQAGFTYKGQNIYFETEKPRWESLTVLQKDLRDIYKLFEKRTRNKINKAIKCGVEIYRDDTKNIENFRNLLKRDDKPLEYYREILASFGKNADIFYAKLNTEQFVINSKKLYEDELEKNAQIAEQFQNLAQQQGDRRDIFNKKVLSDKLLNVYKNNMIFATNVLKNHPEGLIIAGGLSIIYDNAAFLIVEGYNDKFKSLNPHYLLKWRMLSDYHNEKLKYFNMGAICGDFSSKSKYAGLNDSKLGYNSTVTEYIGEYDIILNNMKYNIYKGIKK